MTNFEKLKSLVEADDKVGVAIFLVDYALFRMYNEGKINSLKFINDEYNENQIPANRAQN